MADVTHPEAEAAPAYDRDAYGWALHQARLIRAGRLDEIDVENVAEEIESVGRSERRELTNRLALVIQHILKWQFQPERRGASWASTITEQRAGAAIVLRDNPSLRPVLPEIVTDAYRLGRLAVIRETGLPKGTFPASCPYSFAELMAEDFLPD